MEVYYFTIFVISLCAFFEINHINNQKVKGLRYVMYIIVYMLLVLQMGLRWETGTDWGHYYNMFYSFEREFKWGVESKYNFEIGYTLFTQIIFKLFRDYSIFLLLHAFIFYFFIFKGFKYFTPYFFVALLLFYCITLGMLGSNRSLLAIGIGLYGLTFLHQKKYKTYFALVLLAFFFHTTSLLYLTYFFLNRKIPIWQLAGIVLFGIVLGLTSLPMTLFGLTGMLSDTVMNKSEIYMHKAQEDLANSNVSYLGIGKRIVFAAIFLFYREKISSKLPTFNLMLNGYIFCIAFYFLFYKSLIIMIGRGLMYYNIMEPLLLSVTFVFLPNKIVKSIFLVGLIFLAIFSMNQSIALYPDLFNPYKGIFDNKYFHRNIY